MNVSIIHKQMTELKEKVAEIEIKLENAYRLSQSDYELLFDQLYTINAKLAICENVLNSVK